jgi:outer membrane protein assembly factor BamB
MPSVEQLVFVGLNGWVAALDRDSGEIIWCCSELHSGYTSVLLDGDRLIVSTNGYLYCLDPQNGKVVWQNPMKGYRTGIAHLVSVRGKSGPVLLQQVASAEAQKAATN